MNLFPYAIDVLLEHEGGYVDRADDRGGPTNFGLTLNDMPLLGLPREPDSVKKLTHERATSAYRDLWWVANGFDAMTSAPLAIAVFDQFVLSGPSAIIALQALLGVNQDGKLGPRTVAAANRDDGSLAFRFVRARAAYYVKVVKERPTQIEFLGGWIDRLFSLLDHAVLSDQPK